jgi:hypothetical protein
MGLPVSYNEALHRRIRAVLESMIAALDNGLG